MILCDTGPLVAVEPERRSSPSPRSTSSRREEFDFTLVEVAAGRPLPEVDGLSFRLPNGSLRRNSDRALVTDMDSLPFVTPVYKWERSTSGPGRCPRRWSGAPTPWAGGRVRAASSPSSSAAAPAPANTRRALAGARRVTSPPSDWGGFVVAYGQQDRAEHV
jgi:hypothetical protein